MFQNPLFSAPFNPKSLKNLDQGKNSLVVNYTFARI
jgi:hypothetical protein